MENIFFDSWENILRTTVITIITYVLVILFLRISGKRTLSKMNAFDFIVTIALGSILAAVILNKNVALADGALAFLLLISLQFLITYLSVRFPFINRLVKSQPSLIVYKGQMMYNMMRRERVSEDEIYTVIREGGLSSVKEADAIILETDGTLTVMKNIVSFDTETIKSVRFPEDLKTEEER